MTDDLISRQKAIDALETIGYDFSDSELSEVELEEVCGAVGDVRRDMIDRIKQLPSEQPERIKGRWISADAIFGGEPFYCSECGENTRDTVMGKPRWNFCPNCGADMKGKHDD